MTQVRKPGRSPCGSIDTLLNARPLDQVLGLFVSDGPHRGDFLNWHDDSLRQWLGL
jgi:hypothetical protein